MLEPGGARPDLTCCDEASAGAKRLPGSVGGSRSLPVRNPPSVVGMRSLRFVVLGLALGAGLAVPPAAHAEVWQDRVLECDPLPPGVSALTTSSRTLYVNDCLPNGCTVRSGSDSSLTNTSSIADTTVTMAAYMHGQAHWDEVIACVRETFAPFDIQVTTDDPGTAPHYEVMVAGLATQLNPNITSAGGIAPFISCNAQRNNLLAFVFANQTSSVNYLCTAIAHEAGHVYGLSHSLNALDPMTYMDLNGKKAWQNDEQTCGTSTPENCRCFASTQNSFRYLQNTFGLAPDLAPPTLVLDTPRDGAWVKPGFPIRAAFTSPLTRLEASLTIDGGTAQPVTMGPLAWNAPAAVVSGEHRVSVTATDFADRSVTVTASVQVTPPCGADGACPTGLACLGGLCLPGRDVTGGLGAACGGNGDCVTNSCASDGTSQLCTATCDTGNTCPSGYECLADANLCWPAESGGCHVAGGSPGTLLAGLGAAMVAMRRRRRR